MPLMLDDMRAEFARYLTEDPAARFRMDAALAHVITIAYERGLADGKAAEHERADYAWRNTNTIEKARQEEMAKRDHLLAALEGLLDLRGLSDCEVDQRIEVAKAAIAKAKGITA